MNRLEQHNAFLKGINTPQKDLYLLHFNAPADFLSMNNRKHWSGNCGLIKTWRQSTFTYARAQKMPKDLGPIQILTWVHQRETRKRFYDTYNLAYTVKPIVDGLVDYGVIPDDNDNYVTSVTTAAGGRLTQDAITIMFREA